MSSGDDRFGMPDHTRPLEHAPRGTTNQDTYQPPSGESESWTPPASTGGGGGGGNYGSYYPSSAPSRRKSLKVAVVLAILFGPLGLFYVNILNGIAAVIVIPPVMRFLAFGIAAAVGGDKETVNTIFIPILWALSIPWAIIGVKVRNARYDT